MSGQSGSSLYNQVPLQHAQAFDMQYSTAHGAHSVEGVRPPSMTSQSSDPFSDGKGVQYHPTGSSGGSHGSARRLSSNYGTGFAAGATSGAGSSMRYDPVTKQTYYYDPTTGFGGI